MTDFAVALLFPGQASQYVGMAKDLADRFPLAARTLKRAEEAAGFGLRKLCFEGPAEKLALTEYQQPCVLAASIAAFNVISDRFKWRIACATGHSLGEYSALVAAGSLDMEQAVLLVRKRGRLMQQAVPAGEGAMAALLGRGAIDVEGLCRDVSEDHDACWPANFNSPGQVVISGTASAIGRACDSAKNYGARMAMKLDVSAPFHSPLMGPAAKAFSEEINKIDFKRPSYPIYSNVTAKPHNPDPNEIRELLIKQVDSPVLFEKIGSAIAKRKDILYGIECGPGKVLAGLMKRISPEFRMLNFGKPEDLPDVEKIMQ